MPGCNNISKITVFVLWSRIGHKLCIRDLCVTRSDSKWPFYQWTDYIYTPRQHEGQRFTDTSDNNCLSLRADGRLGKHDLCDCYHTLRVDALLHIFIEEWLAKLQMIALLPTIILRSWGEIWRARLFSWCTHYCKTCALSGIS